MAVRRIGLALLGVFALCGWLLSLPETAPAFQEPWKVVEAKGIEGVGFLGDNISRVQKAWGKAERVVREDWPYSPVWFHEYQKHGALFSTDSSGAIQGITLFCETGDHEAFHQTGLKWINPGSVYATFNGYTAKGLKFRPMLRPEEVFEVYGKPSKRVELGDASIRGHIQNGEPFIVDGKLAGSTIYYPMLELTCTVWRGLIESCGIGGLHGPLK